MLARCGRTAIAFSNSAFRKCLSTAAFEALYPIRKVQSSGDNRPIRETERGCQPAARCRGPCRNACGTRRNLWHQRQRRTGTSRVGGGGSVTANQHSPKEGSL